MRRRLTCKSAVRDRFSQLSLIFDLDLFRNLFTLFSCQPSVFAYF